MAQVLEDIAEKREREAARCSTMGTNIPSQFDGQVHDNFGHYFGAGRHVSGQSALLWAIPGADDRSWGAFAN